LRRGILVDGPLALGPTLGFLPDLLQQAPATDVANPQLLAGSVDLLVTKTGIHAHNDENLLPESLPDLFG
jgi:hypothetical protein